MASATYLQSLDTVYENGDPRGFTLSNRRQVESFIAGAVIAANDLVVLDLSASGGLGGQAVTIIKADKNTDSKSIVIGFALEAATATDVTAGKAIKVTIAGVHETANVAGGATVVKGKRLCISTTPGRAAIYANSDTQPIVAYAMSDAGAGGTATEFLCSVFVIKQF